MVPVTVACVLRSGGDFDPKWVRALKRGVEMYLEGDYRFVCLSDAHFDGCTTYLLAHDWPGWWSKIELWRPDLFEGPVLYMDLDTLPVGDLSDLASYRGDLAVLSDLFQPAKLASGVMAWTPGPHTERIYEAFREDPEGIMQTHPHRMDIWLRKVMGQPDRLQDLYPDQIVSLKREGKDGPPEGCRLVCGHGKPRLSSPDAGWAHESWKSRAVGKAPLEPENVRSVVR